MSSDPVPTRMRHALVDFLDALRAEAGLARSTVEAYRRDVESFGRFARERGLEGFEDVEAGTIVDWLTALRRAGRAEATVAGSPTSGAAGMKPAR